MDPTLAILGSIAGLALLASASASSSSGEGSSPAPGSRSVSVASGLLTRDALGLIRVVAPARAGSGGAKGADPPPPGAPEWVTSGAVPPELWAYTEGNPWAAGGESSPYVLLREYGAAPPDVMAAILDPNATGPIGSVRGRPWFVRYEQQDRVGIGPGHPYRATERVDTWRAANGAILAWMPQGATWQRALNELTMWREANTDKIANRGKVYRAGQRIPQLAGGGRTKLRRGRWEALSTWAGAAKVGRALRSEGAALNEIRGFLINPASIVLG